VKGVDPHNHSPTGIIRQAKWRLAVRKAKSKLRVQEKGEKKRGGQDVSNVLETSIEKEHGKGSERGFAGLTVKREL